MESEQETNTGDDFNNSFEIIFNEFGASMQALQLQDLNSSEKSLIKTKAIYRSLSNSIEPDEKILVKIPVNLIEVATRLLRSIFYSFDERYKKSLEELEVAIKICEETNTSFDLIPHDFLEDESISKLIDTFRYTFFMFERIILTTHETTQSAFLKSQGKFVDEIQLLKNSINEFRKMNDHNFGNINYDDNNILVMMVSMLNRFAELYEKKLERLEEKRKKIEFFPPIDKRVFIVHGHNEGILRELKEILKVTFKLEPIILSDELDNGNTVIEKFEHYGRLSAFAFIIITPDDWVENKKKKYFQARPNVLFELGWFCGRYGRDKVRILRQKDTPLPSDLNGIVTIDFNEKLEEVFRRINKDLEAAGIL